MKILPLFNRQTLASFLTAIVVSLASAASHAAAKFNIWEYRVEGSNLLSARDIEEAIYPFLGPGKDLEVIEQAKNALERLYRDKGYPAVFVDIPEQDVVGGVVYLKATEGKIARLRVSDSDYFKLADIKSEVPSAGKGKALHLPSLQQDLARLNKKTSDLKVVPILKQGRVPGTLEIELKVNDKFPLHGRVELNDHYSKNTTKSRLSASLRYDNLWQKQHSLSLLTQVTPEDTNEVNVLSATYVMPWKGTQNKLAMYAVSSDSEIATLSGESNNGLLVVGNSNIYGVRYVMPFASSAKFMHSMSIGFDYKDVEEVVQFPDDPARLGVRTPLDYIAWTAKYNVTTRSPKVLTRYGVGITFGVDGLGNSIDEFADKRFKGDPDFFHLQGSFWQKRFLPKDWQLISKLKLRLAASPLISNEQMSAGGASSVRGYFESQHVGDRGLAGSLELRTPSLFKDELEFLEQFRGLLFIEAAALEVIDALPGQDERFTLASAGLGVRLNAWEKMALKVDWAYPLSDSCGKSDCRAAGDVKVGEDRFTFSLSYGF